MGAWGNLPWDNDAAADWFGNVFDATQLAAQVEETLELDTDDGHEEIRAAAAVVLLLCHNYIWPVDDIDRHLQLAVKRLEELLRVGVYEEDPETAAEVRAEIQALQIRIKSPGTFSHPKWWHF